MDSLFHFVFAFIAGMALNLHRRYKLEFIFLASLFAVFIDFDHFLVGPANFRPLHTVFVTALAPFLFFLTAFYVERRTGSIKLQTFFLVLMAMLIGHVVADLFGPSPIQLFYPLSTQGYNIPDYEFLATQAFYSPIISKEGIALAAYALILLSILFVEDFIYWHEKHHLRLAKALQKTARDLF